jgi:hypothetical protein
VKPNTSRRYAPNKPGGITVGAHLHRDAADAVHSFAARHGITRSGAIHHLVRIALGLDPLQPLN